MGFCKYCGSDKLDHQEQIFRDKTKHIKIVCTECGRGNGYAKQHNGFDKLLIKDAPIKNDYCIDDLCGYVGDGLRSIEGLEGKSVTIIAKIRS
jgi:hypothetical protein